MDLKIEFTDKEITPWGGVSLLKRMLDKIEFEKVLSELDLPKPGSNRGYSPIQLVLSFIVSVWCGANRFLHTEVTRQDAVIRKLFGWKTMAGHLSFERFFGKFSKARNQRVFTGIYQWLFSQLKFDNYTLDVDSSVLTRYGLQEGATKGYNPTKRGRSSHHPIIAFMGSLRLVANCWLRPGDSHTASNLFSFLQDTFEKLKGKTIGLLRADSGFYNKEVFNWLEEKSINYIIAARMYAPIQHLIASHKVWIRLDDGIEIGEANYKSPLWEKSRRLIIIRQYVPQRPKATGKLLRLFKEESWYKQYRYSTVITNLDLPSEQVWNIYKQRADSENRIKELKYDFGFDSFNMKDFYATEACLNMAMIAYNFMSLFRQAVIQKDVHNTLSTLRYKVFAIGAYFVKEGNQNILKLSLVMKRREWFKGLWAQSNQFRWPFSYS